MATWIKPFFEVTIDGVLYMFGDANANQPRIMDGHFEYTYLANDVTTYVVLSQNTIGAALDAIVVNIGLANNAAMSWWWNIPPSVLENEGRTMEQIMALPIGEERDLRIKLIPLPEATLVDTYVAPLLENDDIVEEFQMDEPEVVHAWPPGPPNQSLLDETAAWQARQALEIPDPTLPPLYNPNTHNKTGTPFARPWDAQDEAELLARQEENVKRISGIIIDTATEILATQVALDAIN